MVLENEKRDRSYLYGRLLGAAEKLEEYALSITDANRTETAALRYMTLFAQRPYTTWEIVYRTLVPYIQKVKGCIAHRELEKIHALFDSVEFSDDGALDGLYLLGYYHERNFIDCEISRIRNERSNDALNKEEEAFDNSQS